ncbi:hypothetical protein CLPU_36c00110 [Gottschalkia purinilytica]|uniref:Uncharacterized protein n=1 Tax=Gottschalkia purinilytica TaxID=1503 RepID=A0A0L0W6W0_GOTPU|nr:hypothetical protein [Gottschalkia purinilytica]KNF06995.1 hypothetical protein CLPU_36c00110 [Gottschalkia purinilytica]
MSDKSVNNTTNHNTTIDITTGGWLGMLTIVFTIAKILNLIDWSWWLVFAPVLIPTGLAAIIVAIVMIRG